MRRSRPRCRAFRGAIMQVPPAFSAVKVAGERAYDMAREGRAPVLEPRPARVDRFELIARPDADTAVFEVESGKGVYMRSLARDLARSCGTRRATSPPCAGCGSGPFARGAGDSRWTNCSRGGRYPAGFPGPVASGCDRAGRHPGAGPDRSRGHRPVAWPGDQPGHADGPHSSGRRSRWRVGARHGGEPRDRAVPSARRLAETRTDAVTAPRRADPNLRPGGIRCRLPRSAAPR